MSMRSLSYFIDVLAIIAFMLILQTRNNAETVASDLKKQEEQLNEYIEQIEVVQQFAPQEAIALRRQRDQQVMQDVQGTLMKLQDLYEQKDQSLTEYQQLVAKLQQQSTLELQSLQKGSAAELQSTVARLEQEKSKALEAKDEQLRQVKANLQETLKTSAEAQQSLEQFLSQTRIERDQLSQKNQERQQQLESLQQQLQTIQSEYEERKQENLSTLSQLQGQLEQASAAKAALESQNTELQDEQSRLQQTRSKLESQLASFQSSLAQNQRVLDRLGDNNDVLQKERNELKARRRELRDQVEGLQNELARVEGELSGRKKDLGRLKSQNENLQQLLAGLNEELRRLKAVQERQAKLVFSLKQLEQTGLAVTNDGKLVLKLDAKSFAYNSSTLESPLIKPLKDVFPKYATVICGDPERCRSISEIRISGYASPTYHKRYIDPKDSSLGSRSAHDYNIRLSFRRAQAVFNFIKYEIDSPYKKEILQKMTHISAHGYLKAEVSKDLFGKSADCAENYDCANEQYVVIAFNPTR